MGYPTSSRSNPPSPLEDLAARRPLPSARLVIGFTVAAASHAVVPSLKTKAVAKDGMANAFSVVITAMPCGDYRLIRRWAFVVYAFRRRVSRKR
jgi:hypothetical protein